MSEIERRPPSRLSRRQREQRAYRLVVATGVFSVAAVVGAVLAFVGVVGGAIPFMAAIFAVICWVLLRRTLSGR
jgi:hypothetical protein